MKGVIFTEFLEMVEEKFGLETVDTIINDSNLESGGAYTSIGIYDFQELKCLIHNLSKFTKIDPEVLIYSYGVHYFGVLTKKYLSFFNHCKNAFQLITGIEQYFHVEIKKIYPDTDLPYLETLENSDSKLVLEYHSKRAFHSFVLGLIEQTFKYYNEKATVSRKLLNDSGTKALFTIIKNA